MQLTSYRVRMFKSVLDSGEIRVNPLTVIVGKNESGKTSLLKALHKLNPAVAEAYRIRDEWPRGHRESRQATHVVCSATFELSDEDRAALEAVAPELAEQSTIRVGRTYEGKLVAVEPETLSEEAMKVIASRLPKFVFMDEYEVFRGTAQLDQVHQRLSQGQPQPEDKAIQTLFALGALDMAEVVKSASAPDKSERRYDLSDAGATITRRMASHWKQMAYEVELDADGTQFFTFVKAPGEQARIKLEERSRGFQWFFSFDAKLLHETQGDLKNCVILLDEPGLHLHPNAQRDLLKRLEEYAVGNTMIYTTHLPFMINLHEPDRIRVLNESSAGTTVSESLTDTSPDAKLTLQAALGMTGRFGMPVGDRNLVVEGAHDYWFITALSDLLGRSGKATLPSDVVITASGGANEATYLGTFMVGQDLQVSVLYDSDAEGRAARDKFVHNWLERYKGGRASAIMLADAVGVSGDLAIEDLFPDTWYLDQVLAIYGRDLPSHCNGRIALRPGGTIVSRVADALAEHGIKFNKGRVAKRICDAIRGMKSATELPENVASRAEALVAAVRRTLGCESDGLGTVVETKPATESRSGIPAATKH